VIEELRRTLPGIAREQLRVPHPGADDDGPWFVTHPDRHGEVQLESSTSSLPFIAEGHDSDVREVANSIDEVVSLAVPRLRPPR
jgi:hypothetical protein